jgi:hypothetical protein
VREEKAGHGKLRAVADRYLELVGIKDPLSGQLDSSSFVKKGVQEEISRIPLADLMRGTVVISSQLRSLLEEDDFLKEIIAEVVSHGDSLTKLLGNKKYVKNATALQKFDMGQAKQEEVRNCLNCYKVFLIRKNNSQNDTPVKRVANNQLWKDYARSVAQQMEAPEVEFVDLRQASTEDNPMLRVFVRG